MSAARPFLLFAILCLTGIELSSPAESVGARPFPPVENVQALAAGATDAAAPFDEVDEAAVAEFAGLENIGIACIALAVFSEARGEPYDGQALVASVIVNRQEDAPEGTGACDIVLAPGQFAVSDWPLPRRPWRIDAIAWRRALEVAQVVASGDYYIPPPCQGATFFWKRGTPAPAVSGRLRTLCEVGDHAFFTTDAAPRAVVAGR